jgi:hypothetical protein
MFTFHLTDNPAVKVVKEHHICISCKREFTLNDTPYWRLLYNDNDVYYRHQVCPPSTMRDAHDARR